MRLIRCHIDGFGKLLDVDFEFESGLNTFLQENGWGKSTLAAFLRVMLYGFEGENRRSDLEKERKRYLPWEGRKYGGNLSFSVGDKSYIVYRSFGSKSKEDSFKLIDAATNLPSEDYSEKLGEELFQIDQASFKRTAFTEQQDLQTGGTDSISTKLSRLCEDTDDLNNYENVMAFLTKAMNNMSPYRSTGSISSLNSEISELNVELKEKEQTENAIKELTTRVNDRRTSGKAFSSELKALKEKELMLIRQESRKAVRLQRTELLKEKEHREEAYRLSKATVPGYIPTAEELEEAKGQLRHLNNLELQLAEKRISEEEMRRVEALDITFANGIPEEEELLAAEKKLLEYQENCKNKLILESELKAEKEIYDKEMSAVGNRIQRIRFRKVYGAFIFLAFLLIELMIIFNKTHIPKGIFPYMVAGTLGLGVFCLTLFFVIIEISYKKASVLPSSDKWGKKEAEVLDVKGLLQHRKQELNAFFTKYNAACQPEAYALILNTIEHDRAEYIRLSDKVTYAEKSGLLPEKRSTEQKIKELLEKSGMFLTGDFQNDLQHLMVCCKEVAGAEKELTIITEKLESFEKENKGYENFDNSCDEINGNSLEELRSRIEGIEENIAENDRVIKQEERRLENLLEQLELFAAKEEMLEVKQEQLEQLKHKYGIYEATCKYLQKAHEDMNARLLAPLSNSFRLYLEELGYCNSGKDKDKVYIDTHAEVTIEEAGSRRELKYFSTGMRDLIAVAMRIALLDNMYEYEKPFIILDDPFVNLDDSKETVAKEFLQKVSEKYQLLYFTCSTRFV